MKKLAWMIGIVALISSGSYIFVYLYRWEWHRALLVGVLFLGAEVALAAALVLRKLNRLDGIEGQRAEPDAGVVARLEQHRPRRDHFAWLVRSDRTAVFLPILLGSGVAISGIAWVIEKITARTSEPARERSLASDLSVFALPQGGLVPDESEAGLTDGDDQGHLRLLTGTLGEAR